MAASSVTVYAELRSADPPLAAGALLGTSAAVPSNGFVAFTDLAVNRSGTGYTLRFFTASSAVAATTSPVFAVVAGPAFAMVVSVQPRNTSAGQLLSPPPSVRVVGT